MSLSLNTNVAATMAQRGVLRSNLAMQKSIARLSSGLRINSAADDAAGLGVSEQMRAELRGLSQGVRNANDGLSVVQTAEGAMGEISETLIRMRELTVQAASDSITNVERGYIDTEFQELTKEIDRITKATKYNGQVLLGGAFKTNGLDFQVGFESGTDFQITVTIADVSTTGLATTGLDVKSKANAQTAMAKLDTGLDTLNGARASLGAKANRLQTAANASGSVIDSLGQAMSRIRDTDVAQESATFARNQVLAQAAVSMLSQANIQPQLAVRLLT